MNKYVPGGYRIYLKTISITAAVLFTQVIELLLLQRKYDLLTGGFLQPHSYITWSARLGVLGISLWIDCILFYILAAIWFYAARKLTINLLSAAYHFIFITCAGMGIWLNIKYEVLSYFNDTINFLVIRNLGGGSLAEAMKYVASEAVYLGFIGIGLVVFYWLGRYVITRIMKTVPTVDTSAYPITNKGIMLVMILITIGLIKYVSVDFGLRYGLSKKTSYQILCNMLDQLTDFDRDGFGVFSFPPDPAPFNAAIYPGALDIPGNGIDENGFGGDFIWQGYSPDGLAQLIPRPGDHIIMIVLESARADMIGKIWEGKTVAPYLNQMAKHGTSAAYAYSHTGFTTSSIKALFNRTLSNNHDRLGLVEFLELAGYQCSFISGQDESFGGMSVSVGMEGRGHYLFDARSAIDDRVNISKAPGSLQLSEQRIIRQFIERSAALNWEIPQFFYINIQAAHFPYYHREMPALIYDRPIPRSQIKAQNRQWLQATYWNAIAAADQAVGDIINRLKSMEVYADTTIVVLGDHGESLFDDNFLGHGHALNETQTRIPLIINRPQLPIRCALGLIDIAELSAQIATHQFNPHQWNDKNYAVLQFIGSLRRPQLVGIVSYGEVRTVLDIRSRIVFFSDLQRWENFDQAWNNPLVVDRVKSLIYQWESACWKDHLSQQKTTTRLTEFSVVSE